MPFVHCILIGGCDRHAAPAKTLRGISPVSSWHFAGTQPARRQTGDLAWQIRARSCITLCLRWRAKSPAPSEKNPRQDSGLGLPGHGAERSWPGGREMPADGRFCRCVVICTDVNRPDGRRNSAISASAGIAVDDFSLDYFCDKPAARHAASE